MHEVVIHGFEEMEWSGEIENASIKRVTLYGSGNFAANHRGEYERLFSIIDCFPSLDHLTLDSRIGPIWHEYFQEDSYEPWTLVQQARYLPHFIALVFYLKARGILELCVRHRGRKEWIEVRWSRRTAAEEFVQERFTISRA